ALCKLFCAESRERAFARARSALCDLVPPGEIDAQLQQLARLHKFTAVNTAEVRQEIVPAILEAARYPLAYRSRHVPHLRSPCIRVHSAPVTGPRSRGAEWCEARNQYQQGRAVGSRRKTRPYVF